MPLVTRTWIEFVGEAVGIAAMCLHVIIKIGVAVDDLVVATKEELRVTVVAAVAVFVESQLQTGIAITIEVAAFDDTIGTFQFHTTVGSLGDFNVAPVPIVGKGIHQHTTKLLGGVVARMRLLGKVYDNAWVVRT